MTRRFPIVLLSLVAVLVLAMPALAQTAVIQFHTVGTVGVYNGYYAGVYKGTVTINGQTTNANFICDDFLTDINNGQSWDANINNSQGVPKAQAELTTSDTLRPATGSTTLRTRS